MSFIKEFINFILERKKFWLIPIFFALLILGGLLVVTSGSSLSPFIYAIF